METVASTSLSLRAIFIRAILILQEPSRRKCLIKAVLQGLTKAQGISGTQNGS
jgi:hypothetical protein